MTIRGGGTKSTSWGPKRRRLSKERERQTASPNERERISVAKTRRASGHSGEKKKRLTDK